MKNAILFFLLINAYTLICQPVITNAIHGPKAGQNFSLSSFQAEEEDQYIDVDPGTAGTNKIWNFESLKGIITIKNSYTDPAILKLKDAVKNLDVNLVNQSEDGGAKIYTLLKVSNTELISKGITDDTFLVQAIPSPLLMKFPFRYGDAFETKSGLKFGDSLEFISTRSVIKTQADAFGSITTADRKYEQVLRVKSYSIDSINISFGEDFQFSFVDTTINYQWFASDRPGIVFQLNTLLVNGKERGDGFSYLISGTTSTAQVASENIKVFPNPFTDKIDISLSSQAEDFELRVLDNAGKFISKYTLDASKASGIDLSSLAPGAYYLQILNGENKVKSVKVIKKQ